MRAQHVRGDRARRGPSSRLVVLLALLAPRATPRELARVLAYQPRARRPRNAVQDDAFEPQVRQNRGRGGGVAERVNLPRDFDRVRVAVALAVALFGALFRKEQRFDRDPALVVLRRGQVHGRRRLVVAHPSAADDVEAAFAHQPPAHRRPRRRTRRLFRLRGTNAFAAPNRVEGRPVAWRWRFRVVRARRRHARLAGFFQPPREERDVREREPLAMVRRERQDHGGVDPGGERSVVPLERVSPSGVEVRVRHQVHARRLGEHGASKEAPWTPRSRKSSSSALSFGCPPPNEAERSSADDGHTRTRNTPRVKRTSAVFTRARISFVRRRAAAPPSSGEEGRFQGREESKRNGRSKKRQEKAVVFRFPTVRTLYRTSPTPISLAPRHSSSPSRSSSATSTLRTNRNVRNSSPRPPPRHPFPA